VTGPLDPEAVRRGLSALLPGFDPGAAEIRELAGDASTRRYYRVLPPPGASLRSVVVMHYPDALRPGEELPFLNVHRYLHRACVPIPEVYRSDPEAHLLFLEDAGDTLLEDAVRERGAHDCLQLYEQCVELLVRIQTEGTRLLDGEAIPVRHAFDVRKFAWEIDFFFEHAVREYGGIPLSDREEREIGDRFLPYLELLASLPRVLAHRDYHSRNVMVLERTALPGLRNLRILDFQDARMGNVFYDMASLLRDSYVSLPEDTVGQLCYAWRHAASAALRAAAGDPGAFAERMDAAALQRNVKALGTFGNQAHNFGKRFYLRFIPTTVAHLRENFARNPSMRGLSGKLLPILDALAEKAASEGVT
jgi:aminoglycoside/choline kinase family phosphotransferase